MSAGAISIWIVFILHLIAMRFFWYWNFAWFDMVMHTLGGLVIGLVAYGICIRWSRWSTAVMIIASISASLFIGYLWEVNEFIVELYTGANLQPSIADTLADLGFDMLGAALAAGIAWIINRNTT